MTGILTEIIGLLVGGITSLATGIGSGVNSLVTSIFIDSTGSTQALSVFGGMVAVFGGIALAVGLSRWVMQFLTSLGARH